jgi:hypothetical protein
MSPERASGTRGRISFFERHRIPEAKDEMSKMSDRKPGDKEVL